jgi:hypothetical protein
LVEDQQERAGGPQKLGNLMASETDLSRSIRKELARLGIWVIRMGVSMKRGRGGTQSGEPGQPDLLLPALGWLETKTTGGELSPVQVAWHSRAARESIRVAVPTSAASAVRIALRWREERAAAERRLSML